jgi:DNA polymerase-1
VIFKKADSYPIALLIKEAALNQPNLEEHYINDLVSKGVPEDAILALSLKYNSNNKISATDARTYLKEALRALSALGVKVLYVCDSPYFKFLTKAKQIDPSYGAVLDCVLEGFTHMKVILGTNYQSLFYNSNLRERLTLSLDTLAAYHTGSHVKLGTSIIKSSSYPSSIKAIQTSLMELHKHDVLTCDIETYSLDFWEADIATISFAWNQYEGIAFKAARTSFQDTIKALIKEFFETYKGKLIYHNANFDIKVLVYSLWMHNLLDTAGMLRGIEVMTRNIEDTKILAYLATNSTAGNNLKLKHLAHEYTGDYAQSDIKDITKIPIDKLLTYNLVDCLATWYVYNKFRPIMVADEQENVYNTVMIPSIKFILQMELTGMPMKMTLVNKADSHMRLLSDQALAAITHSPTIIAYTRKIRIIAMVKHNLLLKTKVRPFASFHHIKFNPNSPIQVSALLFGELGYDPIDFTPTGLFSTGSKTLRKLLFKITNPEHTELVQAIIDYGDITKIVSTFLNAFRNKSVHKTDGRDYLHGSFNLGGTVSGRLSSSGPNMQNLPSTGTVYAKIVKQCFVPPEGWLLVGADFSSLEDRISALVTRDPNKLKVYTDGYDGHCLRAFSYYPSKMPDIQDTVESINSIAELYPDERQDSKEPTFLLTYGGTYHGLINTVGLPKQLAMSIEDNYHALYIHSDKWIESKVAQAGLDGYITVAFGLRLRTPILAQCLLNIQATPYEAKAESRTAGNATGQSYGMLNNRAAIAFQEQVLASKYREDVLPVLQVHDSTYFLIREDLEVLEWVNNEFIKHMEWQDLPELQHDTVKLGGNLSIFHPDWSTETKLPNGATQQELLSITKGIKR